MTASTELPEIRELSREEARAFFDEQAEELLGISGEEFLRRWRAGEWRDCSHSPEVRQMLMLLPWAEDIPVSDDRPHTR